jgi:xanthine dehydrogenase accessory factor
MGNIMPSEEIFEQLSRLLKAGKRAALCTVVIKVGSGPAELGRKILVADDGEVVGTIGGAELFERELKREALKAIDEGKSKSLEFSFYGGTKEGKSNTGLWCGGKMIVFVDVIEPRSKLVIVGSGHVALQTYLVVKLLGFEITVVDNNKDTMTKKRFPDAKFIFNKNFARALKEVKVDSNTSVVVLHGEPKYDLAAVRRFVGKQIAYLGLLGSAKKASKLKEILRRSGVPEKSLKKIHAPIGLDINAQTPEEIAVSIAAELIKERRKS